MFTLCPVEKVKTHSTILLLDLLEKKFYSTFLFSFHFFCFTPKLYIKNGISISMEGNRGRCIYYHRTRCIYYHRAAFMGLHSNIIILIK